MDMFTYSIFLLQIQKVMESATQNYAKAQLQLFGFYFFSCFNPLPYVKRSEQMMEYSLLHVCLDIPIGKHVTVRVGSLTMDE